VLLLTIRDRTRTLLISWIAAGGGRRLLVMKADDFDRDGFLEPACSQ